MKKLFFSMCITLFAVCGVGVLPAQQPRSLEGILFPANPTSADNLKVLASRRCPTYKANSHRVSMSENNITLAFGELRLLEGVCGPLQPTPLVEIDLGRLPAGNYTLTSLKAPVGNAPSETVYDRVPFTIADARASKMAPYVSLDYSGHWWDPNDSGWGLFIWQGAYLDRDNLLAAWFTYTPEGKPMWYVFQPPWETSTSTFNADIVQGERLPSTTSPPPLPGTFTSVGRARLDFTNYGNADEGKLTYNFTDGKTLTRTIRRFRP